MKIPYWIWTGFFILCISQWTIGLWIEGVTDNAKSAFVVIVLLSFVLYPIYCFVILVYVRRKKTIPHFYRRIVYVLVLIGFVTNPAVLYLFKQLF